LKIAPTEGVADCRLVKGVDLSEYRDYENGVADVLAFLVGESATVTRNVRRLGRRSGTQRQIDILVRGRIFGMTDATVMVECKRWGTAIDVKDVEAFIPTVDDVGADIGIMVTTEGFSPAAKARAEAERGVHLKLMTVAELVAWSPPGTLTATYRVPADRQVDAVRALRNAGFRVTPSMDYPAAVGEVTLSIIRHYGSETPPGEVQQRHRENADRALAKIGVSPVHLAQSITMRGGTPGHRWLTVAINGQPTDLKVLAATEAEAEQELDRLASRAVQSGIAREALSVIKPDDWPVTKLFAS
jgi:hypothetical protein